MGWIIYNSRGEPLVTQEQHDHTTADASGPMTDDEHDGFSEYDEIAAPGAGAANKLRVYAVDDGAGVTSLAVVDSAGQALHLPGTLTAKIKATSNQSVNTGALTAIAMDTTEYNTGPASFVDLANNKLVLPRSGVWRITGFLIWAANAAGARRLIAAEAVGVFTFCEYNISPIAGGMVSAQGFSLERGFAVGDEVRLQGLQDCGVALNCLAVANYECPSLSATFVAPE